MEHKDMQSQIDTFIFILKQNQELMGILDYVVTLGLPNFYIAAGVIFQTIWNYYDHKPLNDGIKDIDIIYYNENDLTKDAEKKIENQIKDFFHGKGYPYQFDVHNEARMHLWKRRNQNISIAQYKSSEDAIDKWIATVHAIGITKVKDNIKVYAPYGLSDIFSRTIRPIYHKENNSKVYSDKVEKWQERFDHLNIIKWDEE